jgi:hypothetical protein
MRSAVLVRGVAAVTWLVAVVAALALLVGVGGIVPTRPQVAILVAVLVLAFGLTLVEPAVIPLIATPLLLVVDRVGYGTVDLSWSDAVLFVAFWPAVFLGRRPYSRAMRTLLWLSFLYQVTTLFAVVAHPYTANVTEWFHAWLLVSGALVVGWSLGRAGYARLACTTLMLTAMALAAVTILQAVRQYASGDFSAVYTSFPYNMHKNFVGTTLCFTAALAYARPVFVGWTRRWALTFFWVSVTGILVTQSRQALIGLAVALVIIVFRRQQGRARSRLILLGLAPLLALVAVSVKDQIVSGNEFNSIFQRITWIRDSLGVWAHDPFFGVGLRWWYTDRFEVRFQPPNGEIEVLTSAGVIGLVGFLALLVGALVVLWRIDPAFGTAAFAVLLSRVVQAQFDFFWVASQVSVPFVIVGVCLGACALAHQDDDFVERAYHPRANAVPEEGEPAPTPDGPAQHRPASHNPVKA